MSLETAFAVFVGCILVLAACVAFHVATDQPMPCDSDEVYVWTDHPHEAECVSATDHASHQGEDHGAQE